MLPSTVMRGAEAAAPGNRSRQRRWRAWPERRFGPFRRARHEIAEVPRCPHCCSAIDCAIDCVSGHPASDLSQSLNCGICSDCWGRTIARRSRLRGEPGAATVAFSPCSISGQAARVSAGGAVDCRTDQRRSAAVRGAAADVPPTNAIEQHAWSPAGPSRISAGPSWSGAASSRTPGRYRRSRSPTSPAGMRTCASLAAQMPPIAIRSLLAKIALGGVASAEQLAEGAETRPRW